MPTIASLAVNVVANTAPFAKGMQTARAEAKLLEASIGTLKGIVAGFEATVAAGFTLHGLKSTAEEMDKITKTAAKLGVSAESMSALDYAAQRSGASFEDLSKAIQMMERNIASGKADKYLADIGINVNEIKRLHAEQQFLAIADKVKSLGNEAQRTNDIMGIFGKGGMGVGRMLMEGGQGIQELMDRAKELGLTFDEEMGKKAEDANDAMLSLQSSLKGLARTLVSELGPAIASSADGLANLIAMKDLQMTGGAGELKGNFFDAMFGKMSDQEFQKFYQQQGNARKQAGGLSDLLIGQYGLTRDQVNVDAMDSAVTRRMDSIIANIQQKQADMGVTTGIDGGGNMLGMMTMMGMNFGMAGMEKFPGMFQLPELDPAQVAKISAAVNESAMANQMQEAVKGGRSFGPAFGAFGQEAGTAEAFRQERRTAMSAKGDDVATKHFEEAKQQTKVLNKIDTDLKAIEKFEVVNIA